MFTINSTASSSKVASDCFPYIQCATPTDSMMSCWYIGFPLPSILLNSA